MKIKSLLIAFSTVVVIACSTVKTIEMDQSTIERVKTVYPTLSLEDLNKGKKLYETKCSLCHGLDKPSNRTADKWKHIVPEMVEIANKKTEVIASNEADLILKYLVSMSKTYQTN
jgi:cytochrome c